MSSGPFEPGQSPLRGVNMEKMMSDISHLLEEKEFESMEEANAFLQELLESGQPIPTLEPQTPLEEAQELIYEAWESGSRRRRGKLAKEALEISDDCADAYVILAEDSAQSPEKATEYYELGIEAGERALGPDAFEETIGFFWGIIETRPYMRARLGLAWLLWETGETQQATEHFREMLVLNPSDNQGVRYLLLMALLEEDLVDEARQLIQSYDDDPTAMWQYTNALLVFRQYGGSRKTTKQLEEAISFNPYVPTNLLGETRIPNISSKYIGIGDESEAIEYTAMAGRFWYREAGALDWLRETWKKTLQRE